MPATRKAPAKKTTPKRPQDRKPPSTGQREEVFNRAVTFEWDGEEWTVTPAEATSLEFLEALEDEQIIKALRMLLGREQASRLIRGRNVTVVEGFFEALGQVVDSGNP